MVYNFTLLEAYTHRLIRCYPRPTDRPKLGEYWSEKTWIIVEGYLLCVYGDHPTISAITDIVELPHG